MHNPNSTDIMDIEQLDLDQLNLDFLEEKPLQHPKSDMKTSHKKYKVLVVDDDEEIHKITKISLRNIKFDEIDVVLLDAYNIPETEKMLGLHPDIAVILLDVVMETDDAGLRLVKYIREEIKNDRVRIILRTGQPGVAPEAKVMMEYDINDYKNKTDLTSVNLVSAVMGCLRNYRDIMKINAYKIGLEKVISSTSLLFNYESLGLSQFLNGILEQLSVLINSDNSLVLVNRHFENGRLISHDASYKVIAATGDFKRYINYDFTQIGELIGLENIILKNDLLNRDYNVDPERHYYLGVHRPTFKNHTESFIYVINGDITPENESFLDLFLKNLSLSLDNFLLEQDTDEALYEMLSRISSIVEARDGETGSHVYRVSDISGFIATKLGLINSEVRDFKVASMMHDVGKIAIRDSILLKPAGLTPEEFEAIKKHTSIGGKLFKSSNHQLLKMAEKISRHHHERWNGEGYPEKLSGIDIPVYARIVSIVDVFDALTHDRVYKKAWSIEEAKAYILNERGKMFDPEIVDLFFKHFDEVMQIHSMYSQKESENPSAYDPTR